MPTDPTVELWTLYTLGVCLTILRTYARAVAVGFQKFHADDYLIWLAMVCVILVAFTFRFQLGHDLILISLRSSTQHSAVSAIVWGLSRAVSRTMA
jgi:hypothetical protein